MSEPLTTQQVKEAIEQMKVHCDLNMPEYNMLSARGTLYTLGYEADADQVLQALYDGGFTYCLDHEFATKDGVFPSYQVCYFGPDQLKSRLNAIYLEG